MCIRDRIYPHSAAYAREHGELEQYRASNNVNRQCKESIEAAVREHFDGMYLSHDAAKGVIETYGMERVSMVLSNKMCIRDSRNAYYTEFLPIDPDKADQDLRDVLAHGLMDEADKQQLSTLLQSGRSNSEIAYWLSRTYPREIETLDLENGDIADYRTTTQGMELEVMDAEEKRLAVLYFR